MPDYVLVTVPEDFPDSTAVITKPAKVTLDWLITTKKATAGRFSYSFEPNSQGKIVNVSYVNYVKTGDQLKLWLVGPKFMTFEITERVAEQWILES